MTRGGGRGLTPLGRGGRGPAPLGRGGRGPTPLGRGRRGSFFSSSSLPGFVGRIDGLCSRHTFIHFAYRIKHKINEPLLFFVR